MPTYDYKCLECKYTFEKFQKMTDEHLKNCPKCNGNLKRLIGAGIAPIFKGSGFYQTDYKNSKPKETSTSDSPKTEKKTPTTKKESNIKKND